MATTYEKANKATKAKFGTDGILTHAVLATLSLIACGLAALYRPTADLTEVMTIGTGYLGILLMAITLIIGTINLFRKRRNPVNIDIRRDIGIWAGINTILHVVFGFQVFQNAQILLYFLNKDGGIRTDTFGWSNYVGLVSFLLLLPVLFTSNQLSLKYLKGKRWKNLQRLTYGVFALGIVHTIGYQLYNVRDTGFGLAVVGIVLAVMVAQAVGIFVVKSRASQRKATNSPSAVKLLTPQPVNGAVVRRQFLWVAGGAVLGGAVVGTGIKLMSNTPVVAGQVQSLVEASSVPTTEATTQAASSTTTSATSNTAATTSAAASTTQSATSTTVAPTTTSAATTTATTSGTVLATTTSLATDKALAITTPDTRQKAFLVHRNDGTVTCFSGICTHEPVNLTWNASSQTLYCPRHSVDFSTVNGAPSSAPARTALKKFTVTVDSKGNIIYG